MIENKPIMDDHRQASFNREENQKYMILSTKNKQDAQLVDNSL
jgi:hypothetical protein